MPECDELPCPILRAPTRLDADQARTEVGKVRHHLATREPLLEHLLAVRVGTDQVKHVLCDVQADGSNVHGGPSRFS